MIEVSAEAWNAILYLVTLWQYLLGLGMLFYILSRLGGICLGLAFYILSRVLAVSSEAWHWHAIPYLVLSRLDSFCRGLPGLAALQWHAALYLITSWQYLPKN